MPATSVDTDKRGDARMAFAKSLSEEMGVPVNDAFLHASDRVLMQLYVRGYLVAELEDGHA